jgi:hypothetical protein
MDDRQIINDKNGNPLERLSYPRDIGNSDHFMLFLPIKYVYSGGYQGFVEVKRDSASIVLPLPKNLSDSYSVNWEKEDVGGVVDKLASGNISNGVNGDDLTQVMVGALSKYGSDSVVNALISKFGSGSDVVAAAAAAVTATVNEGLKTGGLRYGFAINPFQAMTFQGTNFRDHSFTFEFFAKSPEESISIRKIIERFRYNMIPGYSGFSKVLFDYPNMFHISFMETDYLYKFKPCVLTNMGINYHAQGDAFYFDLNGQKVPASISVTLQFKETEIITKNDYDGENTPRSHSYVGSSPSTYTGQSTGLGEVLAEIANRATEKVAESDRRSPRDGR